MTKIFGVSLWRFSEFLNDEDLRTCNDQLKNIIPPKKDIGIGEEMGGVEYNLTHFKLSILDNIHEVFQKINPNVKVDNYWVSESSPNTSVVSHNHINPHEKFVLYSAVYYLQAENSGDLYLENPDGFGKILGDDRHKITPATNELIIFPGWVNHWVDVNRSNITRKCIAFDLVLK